MFDRLFEFLAQFFDLFKIAIVIDCYERGVRLRFGIPTGVLEPGFHWVWPLGIDRVLTTKVVLTTRDLPAQTLTTLDGIQIVASAVVVYRIKDPMIFLTEVDEAEDVLADASRGSIRNLLSEKTWNEIAHAGSQLDDEILRVVRTPAFRWGLEVKKVMLSDVGKTRIFRLLND